MEPFLRKVARALLKQHPDGLRDVAVVLPSQRAALYLGKWIAEEAGRPGWSPQMFTIGTFMEELSGLRPLANEELLFEGYEAYGKVLGNEAQSLGDFLQWASVALADISEADAHLVPLETYYRDLRMWEEIGWTFNDQPLSPGQQEMIRYWSLVGGIHRALNENLLTMKAGTTGLIERTAADRAPDCLDRWKAVWFVGLNAFTPAQKKVIKVFHGHGVAQMAWDADRYYVDDPAQEAGRYLREAIKDFGPGVIPLDDGLARRDGGIEVVRAPNNVAQAWCAAELLRSGTADERARTAVVLADESLLMPLLEALPKSLGPVNITMGLAASHLPIGSFLNALHQLHAGRHESHGFFLKDLERLLGHPFLRHKERGRAMAGVLARIREQHRAYHAAAPLRALFAESGLFPEAEKIFVDVEDVRADMPEITTHALAWAMQAMAGDPLAMEQIFQASRVLQRVHRLLERYRHQLDVRTYATVFSRLLAGTRIGFYGEPLAGVQVMGMLEARALDAERLIVLGVKEGVLPANTDGRSYIPFELRRWHHMPLRDDTDAVQAYNFLRMLQRCGNAALIWPQEEEANGPSRFIMQLRHELFRRKERELPVRSAQVDMVVVPPVTLRVAKDQRTLELLRARLAKGLSPSALGDWLRCPLDFHFKQVLGLKESDEFDARIAPNVLGEALHNTVEKAFAPFVGRPLEAKELFGAIDNLDATFRMELARSMPADQLDRGQPMLQYHMALHAAKRFLRKEAEHVAAGTGITLLAQELDLIAPLGQAESLVSSAVKIKGRLDRVDNCEGMVRILDMKTGKVKPDDLKINGWDLDQFRGNKRYAAQLMVYAWLYLTLNPAITTIEAGVLPLQQAQSNEPYRLTVAGRTAITREELPAMAAVLARAVGDMMDPELPVEHDPESKYCTFCLPEIGA